MDELGGKTLQYELFLTAKIRLVGREAYGTSGTRSLVGYEDVRANMNRQGAPSSKLLKGMVGAAGLEPATDGL